MSKIFVNELAPTGNSKLTMPNDLILPAGHVVQTEFLHSTTRTAISSSSYSATALQKAITPKFQNSLIYIMVSSGFNTEASGRRIDVTIQRGTTVEGLSAINLHEDQGLSGGSDRMTSFKHHGNRNEGSFVLNYVDSPNTIGSVTYHVLAREEGDGQTIEIPSSNTQVQCMVLQEIKQ